MKLDIEKYEQYALIGAFGPIVVLTLIVFMIIISPFALLGYIISKMFKIDTKEIIEWKLQKFCSQDNVDILVAM